MNEWWRVVCIGGAYWVGLSWLPLPIDPCLFMILVLGAATTHAWGALCLTVGLALCTEAVFLIRPGLYLVAYLMAFTVLRVLAHRFHLTTFWMRLGAMTCSGVLATLALKQLYLQHNVPWRAMATVADTLALALTILVAAAIVPMFRAWQHRVGYRPRGLIGP